MSSPVFTARADWTIPRAARELRRRHVKQLPVVGDDGLLTGIVTRSDLLDAFIRSDVEIRGEVEQDVLGRILGLVEGTVAVEVRDGVVTLRGTSRNRASFRWSWASARASTVSSPWTPTSPPPGRARCSAPGARPQQRQADDQAQSSRSRHGTVPTHPRSLSVYRI
ncbi:CBS domain-containing protein [Streptomyces sp. Tue 6430]|nr:CBS domain-containing protein [Streptomyces sp. Tue 6430]